MTKVKIPSPLSKNLQISSKVDNTIKTDNQNSNKKKLYETLFQNESTTKKESNPMYNNMTSNVKSLLSLEKKPVSGLESTNNKINNVNILNKNINVNPSNSSLLKNKELNDNNSVNLNRNNDSSNKNGKKIVIIKNKFN